MTSANFHLSATRSLRAGLAAIAGLIAISAANAADAAAQPADAPAMLVRFTDLNIMTEQGASSLYRRIALAARHVCPQADIRDLKALAVSQSCQQQAVARAVQAVSSPQLAALYAARAKHS
jgi:UrcA family protein